MTRGLRTTAVAIATTAATLVALHPADAGAHRQLGRMLAADGQSRLSPLETVERGYGRLVERLQGLGARVAKMS